MASARAKTMTEPTRSSMVKGQQIAVSGSHDLTTSSTNAGERDDALVRPADAAAATGITTKIEGASSNDVESQVPEYLMGKLSLNSGASSELATAQTNVAEPSAAIVAAEDASRALHELQKEAVAPFQEQTTDLQGAGDVSQEIVVDAAASSSVTKARKGQEMSGTSLQGAEIDGGDGRVDKQQGSGHNTEEEEEEEGEEEEEEEGEGENNDDDEDESSEMSGSDEDGSWISWFCSLRGNEFFCEVDEDYIQDAFNLTGLNGLVPYYDYALDMVLDVEMPMEDSLTEEQQEIVESAAEMLYGLIHARYIVTNRGMHAMYEKYRTAAFGRCPHVFCQGQPVLPVGLSDLPRNYTVNAFCPRCHGLYFPKSTRQANVDGAYFGTTFPHLFLMTHPDMIPSKPMQQYRPRVYGFKIHQSSLYHRNHELNSSEQRGSGSKEGRSKERRRAGGGREVARKTR